MVGGSFWTIIISFDTLLVALRGFRFSTETKVQKYKNGLYHSQMGTFWGQGDVTYGSRFSTGSLSLTGILQPSALRMVTCTFKITKAMFANETFSLKLTPIKQQLTNTTFSK